ncbi:hypothetical protein O3P69_009935 [Scylla paramamosain]|uniref:Uncharacterized protein n=1 Tax=Scylla paramamosain TaxID=85552 RepID=A0AAW0SP20_SCYPA
MEKYLIKKRKCAEEKEEEVAEDIIKSKRTCVEGTDGDVTVKPGESETSRPGHIVESEENEVRVEIFVKKWDLPTKVFSSTRKFGGCQEAECYPVCMN